MALQVASYRFNVDKYCRLAELGILSPGEHVELIGGRIWEMHPPAPRHFTAQEYNRMVQAGILREDEHVELLEGEIVEMSPIGKRHAGVVNRLTALLQHELYGRAVVAVQNPLSISFSSQPEPDIALLRFRPDYYTEELPSAADTLLVVEVADTSLLSDREIKIPLYASAGIPEVWLVNLVEELIQVFSGLQGGVYEEYRQVRPGEFLAVPAFDGVQILVSDVLGSESLP